MPLVPFQLYNVDDGTGEITVLSRTSRSAPSKGARVQVKGKVNEVASFGSRSRSACTSKSRAGRASTERSGLGLEATPDVGCLTARHSHDDDGHVVVLRRRRRGTRSTASKIASTIPRADVVAVPRHDLAQRGARRTPTPRSFNASKMPSVQNTNRSSGRSGSSTSS